MAKQPNICSLFIENLKPTTRSIARQILGPYKSGLIHFQALPQVNYALVLETNNQIRIKTDIPQEIYSQLNVVPEESDAEVIAPAPEVPSEPEQPVEPIIIDKEETPVVTIEEDMASDVEVVKPEWYLTWDQVEKMNKGELIEWSEKVEGLTIAKSKNAGQVTTIVHEFLAAQFEDHVAE